MTKTTLKEYVKAVNLAIRLHTNQTWGKDPYYIHLEKVEGELLHRGYIDDYAMRAAAWCHDLLEDTPISYNELRDRVSEEVAELVYCVTDEKGRTRSERHNQVYWNTLKSNKKAINLKLADRLANVKKSIAEGSTMLRKYQDEYKNFEEEIIHLVDETGYAMLSELYDLIQPKEKEL